MKNFTSSALTVVLLFIAFNSGAQATYDGVYNILQANCTVGCHTSSSPSGNLDLSGTSAAVYSRLVDKNPTNPAALAKGHKIIAPGNPEKSFLVRKCNKGWDSFYELDVAEGTPMPPSPTSLAPKDLELIRQWIYNGAPQSGNVVSVTMVNNFYNGMGKQRIERPAPPSASEGFQLRVGPFLRNPGTEIEYRLKHELKFADTVEITRIECFMNSQSHHFILDKFNAGSAQSYPNGLRGTNSNPGTNATMVDAWQVNRDSKLPFGTAYYWDPITVLDYNYHILNYDQDSVLGAEVYLNVYTQPKGTAQTEMFTKLVVYPPFMLAIPATGQSMTFSRADYETSGNNTMYVHMLSSHTHKYGIDYDIYKRNANGSRGDQIYEGFYNSDYSFNQGYYDWVHPAVRYFEPLEPINARHGLIHEAKFKNTGNSLVTFGLTTEDEMMLYTIQYTLAQPVPQSVDNHSDLKHGLNVSPNPSLGESTVRFMLEKSADVKVELYNVLGERVQTLINGRQQAGPISLPVRFDGKKSGQGVYFVRLTVDGNVVTRRLINLN